MGGIVDGTQVLDGHVGVNLGRVQLRMAEQGLQHAHVAAGFEHVRGHRMAQQVRRTGLLDAREVHVTLDVCRHELGAHRLAVVGHEQCFAPHYAWAAARYLSKSS